MRGVEVRTGIVGGEPLREISTLRAEMDRPLSRIGGPRRFAITPAG